MRGVGSRLITGDVMGIHGSAPTFVEMLSLLYLP